MAELTQAATVLSVNDLTPHVRQLVLLPTVQNIAFQARPMGFTQTAGRCRSHRSIGPIRWQRRARRQAN